MEELKRTKRITIGVIAFIAVLVIGFLTVKKPVAVYKLSPQQMNDDLIMVYQVTPEEASEMMGDSVKNVFVDIRSIYDYEKDHLYGAVNIPIPNLLDKEIQEQFDQWKKDSVTVVLYGNDQLQANSPWMLMYQLGYDNTRVLLGGIKYYDDFMNGRLAENETFEMENPAYDFKKIIAEGSSDNSSVAAQAPQKEVVVRKKKKKAAEGGC
ncbi:MAG: rhodanese-like domain-containing protein [Cyclobacteriaceae bacterium]|nr:rhodanese-like domain-containing protein [Cyclobacteriaceae bacterium]